MGIQGRTHIIVNTAAPASDLKRASIEAARELKNRAPESKFELDSITKNEIAFRVYGEPDFGIIEDRIDDLSRTVQSKLGDRTASVSRGLTELVAC